MLPLPHSCLTVSDIALYEMVFLAPNARQIMLGLLGRTQRYPNVRCSPCCSGRRYQLRVYHALKELVRV